MELIYKTGGKSYAVDLSRPHDISIPVRFDVDGDSLSAFGAAPARREAYKTDGFIGAVHKGGSCNCDMLTFSPHLHGTHTECVGHIADTHISVSDIAKDALLSATVITVSPQTNRDSYKPALRATDSVITNDVLAAALKNVSPDFMTALVIRTKPNDDSKRTRAYGNPVPPFFSQEAMATIANLPIQHLLVDMPSIDRMDDEGMLTNHHIFWGVEEGSHRVKTPSPKTVTELIYVPDSISDGSYMLNLQIASFAADAAPSRPVLYGVKPL